jgi:hypothetical protein
MDEILAETLIKPMKVLNPFSSRSSFFTILTKGERFTNPFFRLLNSLNRNAEIF